MTYLTVVNSCQELVAAQRKLRSIIAVHPLTSVVQMLKVMWRHYGEKEQEGQMDNISTVSSNLEKQTF